MNTDIRKHFNGPKAKFVCVTLGQTDIERPCASDVAIFEAKVAFTPTEIPQTQRKSCYSLHKPAGYERRNVEGHQAKQIGQNRKLVRPAEKSDWKMRSWIISQLRLVECL
jgi:hypothetical protein